MPAKMPKLLRFASTPPLQRHPRKAPAAVPGSDARNAVATICAIYEGAKDAEQSSRRASARKGCRMRKCTRMAESPIG
jgi:hypothetical protein